MDALHYFSTDIVFTVIAIVIIALIIIVVIIIDIFPKPLFSTIQNTIIRRKKKLFEL